MGIRQSHPSCWGQGMKDWEINCGDSASGNGSSRQVGRRTRGFLWPNVFRKYVVEIDYAKPRLCVFTHPARLLVLRLRLSVADLQSSGTTYLTVRERGCGARTGPHIPVCLLVDSGATTSDLATKASATNTLSFGQRTSR